MKYKKVLVVLGGTSKERKVSLESGKACCNALKNLGYNVTTFDPLKKNLSQIDKTKTDVIFNALHGQFGEDGYIQTIIENYKIPYTHSGVIASAIAMDKDISKRIFLKNEILTPKYINFTFDKNSSTRTYT